ncbi:MAG: hypothetical protein KDE58_30655 [Caldilineaceae bacterium]|nr:hypothetical protein [Caldilineaceae bacterium]
MALTMRGRWQRWDKKATTDDCDNLDMTRFAKSVDMTKLCAGSWRWTYSSGRKSSISYCNIPGDGVRLQYSSNGQDYNYLVKVATTTPNYGGTRYYWRCPSCNRRARIIYGGTLFLCRHCHGLTYATAQSGGDLLTTIDNRLYRIREKLQGDWHFLQGPGEKPKHMHWRTYSKLACEYLNLLQMRNLAWMGSVAGIVGGLSDTGDRADELQAAVMDEWRHHKQNPHRAPHISRAPVEDDDEQPSELNRLTLGDLAQRAGVPYAFAKEAVAEGLLREDKGRTSRKKRYRERLKNWLHKLHTLRDAGTSWDEIRDWSKRRFKPGHEHERTWPQG